MTNISTQIGDIPFKSCIYNASGCWCRTLNELDELYKSNSGAVLSKSCTIEAKRGNFEPRYFNTDLGSINSMGLPNFGYKYYSEFYDKFTDKPYIISISGMNLDDNVQMILEINRTCIKNNNLVEVNLSCPNLPNKPQVGYDFEQVDLYLSKLTNLRLNKCSLGFKLPPYFDPVHFQIMANIINKYNVSFITCINSLGNGLIIDPNKEVTAIYPKGGLGGIGGDYCKPIALANVRQFYNLLNIPIIGCGGIKNGSDIFEHILAGASAVQVGPQLVKEGPKCFERLEKELINIMDNKDYHNIKEFKGKLRVVNS